MSQPLIRATALVGPILLAAACQTTDPEREALVAQCRAQGHMLGETALEDCVQRLAAQNETFRDRTGSCVKNCNR